MRYYLRVGDMLCNRENGAVAIVTRITGRYVYFQLLSQDSDGKPLILTTEKATKREIYYHLDKGEIEIHYGSTKRRRTRKGIVTEYY